MVVMTDIAVLLKVTSYSLTEVYPTFQTDLLF
jgi:hypothetical protein